MKPIIDPRQGDIETDVSSTKRRSLLSLAGGLLVEISLPKLLIAWMLLLVVPGLLLGLAPIVASDWLRKVSGKIAAPAIGIGSALLFAVVIAVGWFGWRTLFRLAEKSFWSLNSVVVQPGYATCREALRHIAERLFASDASKDQHAKLRAAAAAAAGVMICGLALLVLWLVWPSAHLFGSISEIGSWRRLVVVALANSAVLVAAYLAVGAMVWATADATMAQPRDLGEFHARPYDSRVWRIAHLSDVHVVGERYGFRIESGRSGPRGNVRLKRVLAKLQALHAKAPLDAILITGDMTDAGSSAEWAEFLEVIAAIPISPNASWCCRAITTSTLSIAPTRRAWTCRPAPTGDCARSEHLSAIAALQGRRVRVVDYAEGCLGKTLEEALQPHLKAMIRFADAARPRLSYAVTELWAKVFPMVLPPDRDDGLGIILLNSNADTHFSFTNALGMVSAEQVRGLRSHASGTLAPVGLSPYITTSLSILGLPRRCPSESARR